MTRCLVALVVSLGLCQDALAEVFVFHDRTRGEVRGKVLAEFDELLYVKLDGQEPGFIFRVQLEAIISDEGQRDETITRGAFAPLSTISPAGAVTDVVGEAWVTKPTRAPTPASTTPVFLEIGHKLSTSDAGFARAVMPTGTTLKLSPETELEFVAARSESVQLRSGEVFLSTRLRPLQLEVRHPLSARVARGSIVTLRRADDATHIRQHKGHTAVEATKLRFTVQAGQGLEMRRLAEDSWRLTADPANPEAITLHTEGGKVELQPGDSHIFGASPDAEGDLWRLLVSRGELRVRKGNNQPFSPLVGAQRDRLVLGPGDAVKTASKGGSATLVRVSDGGTLTLQAGTVVELNGHVILKTGKLTVEALEAPIPIETATGIAGLSMSVVELRRAPRSNDYEATAVAGTPVLAVGPLADLIMEQASVAQLMAPARVTVKEGASTLHSRTPTPERDPVFRVRLKPGGTVGVRQQGSNALLDLPGQRVLEFAGAKIHATVELEPQPRCLFPSGAKIALAKGLHLALANDEGDPELRFVKGPRLTVEHSFTMRVENPTVVLQLPDRELSIKLEGDLHARLREGGPHSVAALGVRDDDYLEISGGGDVVLDRFRDLTRFSYSDARRLWIQDEAPPVQSRFADTTGTAFLTMPDVPALGLGPNRDVTVLATRDGEFVFLDRNTVDRNTTDLEGLSGAVGTPVTTTGRDPTPNLLDLPPAASPSGP